MGLRHAIHRWRARADASEAADDSDMVAFYLPPARTIMAEPNGAPPANALVLGTATPPSADGTVPAVDQTEPAVEPPVAEQSERAVDQSEPAVEQSEPADESPAAQPPAAEQPAVERPAVAPVPPFTDPDLLAHHRVPAAEYDHAAVREAWALVCDRADELVAKFYAEVFLRVPQAPQMFPSSMIQQRQDFGRVLVQWVAADDPATLTPYLRQLGDDHRKYDAEPHHYDVVGGALASAWKALAGAAWTPRHESAVLGSYARLASTMLDGAMAHADQPASWDASVVAHERIRRDFAVIRIEPDQPYPYRAGQYLTLELPDHRRQWRQMSIASAPGTDNRFDLHVRAVGGLGVSSALVNHTSVGDRLRLGPPRGQELILEPGSAAGGLLCIAAGTGAAPITAVVESVLGWSEPPPRVDVFIGARTNGEVYGVDTINRIIREHSAQTRAHAYAVVSDDGGYVGARGLVEVVVPSLRDWAGLGVDVLIAGPDSMIETTVSNLLYHHVPRGRIHFDQYQAVA